MKIIKYILSSIALVVLAGIMASCSVDEEGLTGSFPYLEISTTDTTITKVAASTFIKYRSNREVGTRISSACTWLSAEVDKGYIILNATENPLEETRSTSVEIFTSNNLLTHTIQVVQDASGELTIQGDLILKSKAEISQNTYSKTKGNLLIGAIDQIQTKATSDKAITVDIDNNRLTVSPSDIDDNDIAILNEKIKHIGGKTVAILNSNVKQFPTELFRNNNVVNVYLDYNNIVSLPEADQIKELGLEKLSIRGNNLKSISAIQDCQTITHLDISGNDIYNLSPLLKMNGLQKVVLSGLPLTYPQVEIFKERKKGLEVVAEDLNESSSPLPIIDNVNITELSDKKVKLTARIRKNSTDINKVGFYIGDKKDINTMTFHECQFTGSSFSMTYDVETLTNQVYHVRAYAENSVGRGYSSAGYFGRLIAEEDIFIRNMDDLNTFGEQGFSHINGSLIVGNTAETGDGIRLDNGTFNLVFKPFAELTDLSKLNTLLHVRDGIFIGNTGLNNAECISQIEGAQTLWLKGNALSALPALASDATLTSLNISMNAFEDFSFLKRMKNLTHLYLGDSQAAMDETNKIYSLEGLEEFRNLQFIDLGGLPLLEWQVQQLKENMPETTIEFTPGNQTPYLPEVTTLKPKTDGVRITLRGTVKSEGMGTVTEFGFYYGKSLNRMEKATVDYNGTIQKNEVITLDIEVPDMDEYYFRAYAANAYGESMGEVQTFTMSYQDISKDGTANCYIVPGSGKYKFNATVKGNSTESVGTPAAARVLWGMTTPEQPGTIISGISLNQGYVEFTIGDQVEYGNALVAVEDANGEVLWSWHIWVCDFDPEQTVKKYANGFAMMDRNLGATLDKHPGTWEIFRRTEGLFYQWGRKDPFTQDQYTVRGQFNFLSESIKNPTAFGADYTWLSADLSKLWSVEEKTMYDPCPHGWRVPENDFINNMSVSEFSEYSITAQYNTGLYEIFPIAYTINTDGTMTRDMERTWWWTARYTSNNPYGTSVARWSTSMSEINPGYGQSIRCSKDESFGIPQATVVAVRATEIEIKGEVDPRNFGTLSDRGFVWGENWNENMTSSDANVVSAGSGNGTFTATITGLKAQTTYFIRPYVRGKDTVKYGDLIQVRTLRTGLGDQFTEDEYEW